MRMWMENANSRGGGDDISIFSFWALSKKPDLVLVRVRVRVRVGVRVGGGVRVRVRVHVP